jgi:hypothetical protein
MDVSNWCASKVGVLNQTYSLSLTRPFWLTNPKVTKLR